MAPTAHSAPQPHTAVHNPLTGAMFTLNSSGVAGFFGGDTAVHGMATVNLFCGRKWGGWYNSPGSYEIAKKYGQLASERIYQGLFPGASTNDPSQLFGLDGQLGPKFLAAWSGSQFEETGHLAALIMRMARNMECTSALEGRQRITTPVMVTVIDLQTVTVTPELSHHLSALLSMIPIGASIGACVGCVLIADWWSLSSILLGMFANGCACFVLGSGKLTFKHHQPAEGAPRGDGIFISNNTGVVIIRGEEGTVNCLTHGRFYLHYGKPLSSPTLPPVASQANGQPDGSGNQPTSGNRNTNATLNNDNDSAPEGAQPSTFKIGLCSILLTAQFLVQLLLIPQGVLMGQLMFISSLAVSWAYNTYLSSINRDDIQIDILRRILNLNEGNVRKFRFGTWTAMSTFACLALQHDSDDPLPDDASMIWDALLPKTTEVWAKWRKVVNSKLCLPAPMDVQKSDWKLRVGEERFSDRDKKLLRKLLKDAQVAHLRYMIAYGDQRQESDESPEEEPESN